MGLCLCSLLVSSYLVSSHVSDSYSILFKSYIKIHLMYTFSMFYNEISSNEEQNVWLKYYSCDKM